METKKGADTRWVNANKSLQNYRDYISRKGDKLNLTYIDLLYVSNFKGGNSSIHEFESIVNDKLIVYSRVLKELYATFGERTLDELLDKEMEILNTKIQEFLCLTLKENTRIFGFKSSYASALLNSYFPSLIPILDRRVLNGLKLAPLNSAGQIDNPEIYMPALIDVFRTRLKRGDITLRNLDREFYRLPISKPTKQPHAQSL